MESERQQAPLEALLRLARELSDEVEAYTATAVHEARAHGWTWDAVAESAGVSADTARSRWSDAKVRRLLARRADRRPTAGRPGESGPAESAGGRRPRRQRSPLAAALSTLQRDSGVSIQTVAAQADLSASYISRVLAGERTPTWAVVHMLATILKGDARQLRLLWEAANGMAHPSRKGITPAAEQVTAALRGLHLAAGTPSAEQLCSAAKELELPVVQAVLRGDMIPDWTIASALVTALGGQPADLRHLWEDLHYSFIVSAFPHLFPRDGVPWKELPAGADDEQGPP
ncbi:helix-turn-helix domain-containing protein [Kitasatospora sp. NPDC101801]|uniref:helix-turn-helix domain-containing protein n=1 Tax=Kitasatospora sp. NPDC101801 TaxID=3364103 RepID=UPI00382E6004